MIIISDGKHLVDRIIESSQRDYILPQDTKIAYFSMEMGLEAAIHTYGGGLGILAGDTIKTAADMGLPMVAVTFLYHKGYFKQQLGEDGSQQHVYTEWNPQDQGLEKVELKELPEVFIDGEMVKVQPWIYRQEGLTGETVPVIFLDTRVEGNSGKAKKYSDHLYGRDPDYKLAQEAILAFGGLQALEKLGYKNIEKYHMNEGHSALLATQLLKEFKEKEEVRKKCVFTNHTLESAGNDQFREELVRKIIGNEMADRALEYGRDQHGNLNMSLLALNLSGYSNGVSQRHAQVASAEFGYDFSYITNGVHPGTWTSPAMKALFDEHLRGWSLNPEKVLPFALNLKDKNLFRAHQMAKRALQRHIHERYTVKLDLDVPTVGWARRFAAYKRANLLFSDIERLKKIAVDGPMQFVIAGKAHPSNSWSQDILKQVFNHTVALSDKAKIVFLENYNIEVGKLMTAGCDFWLNTPIPPREASGTSGMKAAFNGVINISSVDGWWWEAYKDDVSGFSVGPTYEGLTLHPETPRSDETDANDLYETLEKKIIPLFHDKDRLGKMMKTSIILASYFNTFRMMKEYLEAYGLEELIKKHPRVLSKE